MKFCCYYVKLYRLFREKLVICEFRDLGENGILKRGLNKIYKFKKII